MRPSFLSLATLCLLGVSLSAQSPFATPLSRVVRNQDGTMLSIQVDPNNQRVEEILTDKAHKVLWRLVRELDEDMQPMQGVKFDAEDQILSRHRYLCLRGRVEEEEVLDAKNTLLAKLVYFYDNKGRINRIDQYNPAGKLVSSSKSSGGGIEPVRREVSSKTEPAPPKSR